jgi:hypothetical protein
MMATKARREIGIVVNLISQFYFVFHPRERERERERER